MSNYLGMLDDTVEIITPPDVLSLAHDRYWEASLSSDTAYKEVEDMAYPLTISGKYIELQNLKDAAFIADGIAHKAYGDYNDLYRDCECGVYGPTCRKCSAYARVMAWHKSR